MIFPHLRLSWGRALPPGISEPLWATRWALFQINPQAQ